MRKFKTESKKLLDLMVNSIYTNKEIFLRELISNASDSLDKLYLSALEAKDNSISRSDLKIDIVIDPDQRTLTISDNGIGMNKDELEKNLGTIAHSGSLEFKADEAKDLDKVDIIGQFGVGFYSSFMVASKVKVISRAYGSDEAACWESDGVEGYTISDAERESRGTDVILYIREDEDGEFDRFLSSLAVKHLVKHYSDYIRYPICMDVEHQEPLETNSEDASSEPQFVTVIENETLNSMIPIWTKKKSDVSDDEYNNFYKSQFYDNEDPLAVISLHAEGTVEYDALLFIPKEPPFDFYSKEYKRGLALYSSNVMIMEQCEDLLPDCFGFVRGVVDSPDLNLNISREMLQHDRQLQAIEHRIEKKVRDELAKLAKDDREAYAEWFSKFGHTFKYAIYATYGGQRDLLQDLLLFYSAREQKLITLKEYVEAMGEGQNEIYFAYGDTAARLAMSPSVKAVLSKDFDVLLCSDNVDEFCLSIMNSYDDKQFRNVADESLDLGTEEEKEEAKKVEETNDGLFTAMSNFLGEKVTKVVASTRLTDGAACITADGPVSLGMEKYFATLPESEERPQAKHILELNPKHSVFPVLQAAMEAGDAEKVEKFATILYSQALMAEGLDIEDPEGYTKAVLSLMK